MGGRIPKSAQRAIDKANQNRVARLAETRAEVAKIPVPRMMDIAITPRNIINLFDIYFNGVKQRLCVFASVDMGCIRRWSSGVGNVPDKGAHINELFGKVEIKRKPL